MSDPLCIVQAVYAAFGRGDVPALLELLADDASWQFLDDRSAPYTGHFDTRGRIGERFAPIPQVGAKAFGPRESFVGSDHVTMLGRGRTAAVPSGKVFECEWVHLFDMRDGRITRFWGMYDTEAAAAARR